ncbi:hypothetical protein L2E82_46922 [Cichorium intybus]|uniref:Uncharacterized protein n=1 Tax=Cichorium intybus TaxID=13427 RepID=A0ACB8YV29_CICIN|nr:hypothetical protein L2E82_46922 [Cichorium intybus]
MKSVLTMAHGNIDHKSGSKCYREEAEEWEDDNYVINWYRRNEEQLEAVTERGAQRLCEHEYDSVVEHRSCRYRSFYQTNGSWRKKERVSSAIPGVAWKQS